MMPRSFSGRRNCRMKITSLLARTSAIGRVMRVLPVLAVLFSFNLDAKAQWVLQSGEMDQQIRRGINLIYNMEFDNAERTFDSVIATSPEHPAGYFYSASVVFWRAITNPDNTTYDALYRSRLQQAIDKSDALLATNERDIAGIFYKGAALGMRARIFAIRPNWQDAIDIMLGDAKEGIRYLNLMESIIPSNPDVMFGRGLYNYYVEAVKEDNPLLAPIIGIFATGNKRIGLQMLEIASQKAVYAKTEAQYELMKVYYTYEKNYVRANAFAQYLTNKFPNNVQFLHYLGFTQVAMNLTTNYDSTYRVILARAREKRPGYTIRQAREAMFYLGQSALFTGKLDSALYYLYNSNLLSRKIMQDGEINSWITRSELMMGQAYDKKGDRKRALEMYRRVLDMDDKGNSHATAERYLERPYQ
jgi:tetratricopeptide (TPR) repeat protein